MLREGFSVVSDFGQRLRVIFCLGVMLVVGCMGGEVRAEGQGAKPKLAHVRIREVFKNYQAYIRQIVQIERERQMLQEHPRVKRLKEEYQGLFGIGLEIQQMDIPEQEKERRLREAREAELAFRAYQKDTTAFIRELQAQLKEKKLALYNDHYKLVRDAVQKLAEQGGYALVFETDGMTSTKAPLVLYLRDSTDLTEEVVQLLNEQKTTRKAPVTAPEPDSEP